MNYKLSVIICTSDRYEALRETIDTLAMSAGYKATDCEVLVVENTPVARREPIHVPDLNFRIEICEEPGLSNARNHGIAHAAGDIIVFLDDDALVCDTWCIEILRAFEAPNVMVVGGKVDPKYPMSKLPTWYDEKLSGYLSCIDWGPRSRRLRVGEWIVGANMAFRKEVFEQYGLFDPSLGRKGNASLLSNDETALLERIGMQRVLYCPDAAVLHVIPANRMVARWFRRRVYWQAISDIVSGLVSADHPDVRAEYGKVIGQLEAERRNLNALSFEAETYEQFAIQLRAIYLAAVVLGAGGA